MPDHPAAAAPAMVMNKKYLVCFLLLFCQSLFSLSPQDADSIAVRIWKNECGGTVQGLTCWNQGENFASLGIGHFIWFPANSHEPFQETFPELLKYIQSQEATIPKWLLEADGCPWKTRDAFYQDIESPRMKELRQFLLETKSLQAAFIEKRLSQGLPQMIRSLPKEKQANVILIFTKLSQTPRGAFALIDYANFKGLGILQTESYNDRGWGLLQVLLNMKSATVEDYILSAQEILTERVKNSPPERNEERWLKGWLNRIQSY